MPVFPTASQGQKEKSIEFISCTRKVDGEMVRPNGGRQGETPSDYHTLLVEEKH